MRGNMKIIAVDDEKLALESILNIIRRVRPSAAVTGFQDALSALDFVAKHSCDVAFLDIEMREMNGVTLAKKMKSLNPKINIIFTTGYAEYRKDAFELHASGYVEKPVTPERVLEELAELRHPVISRNAAKLRVKTFGNFEVYADGKPLDFRYSKSKEMFAYLIDRNGALCSNGEIMSVLWEDEDHISYMKNSRADMINTLKKCGHEDVVVRQWGRLGIDPEKIECDYFAWNKGDVRAINAYRGEYMNQYSWAEITHASLQTSFEEQK